MDLDTEATMTGETSEISHTHDTSPSQLQQQQHTQAILIQEESSIASHQQTEDDTLGVAIKNQIDKLQEDLNRKTTAILRPTPEGIERHNVLRRREDYKLLSQTTAAEQVEMKISPNNANDDNLEGYLQERVNAFQRSTFINVIRQIPGSRMKQPADGT